MRTLLIGCLMLAATVSFAQTANAPSVAMGQNADGQNVVVTIIPLKYLDPLVAADLLTALGYPGTVIPVNPPHGPGEGMGAYQGSGTMGGHTRGRAGTWRNNNSRGNDNGYDAYNGYNSNGNANALSQRYPGYQSPYSYR